MNSIRHVVSPVFGAEATEGACVERAALRVCLVAPSNGIGGAESYLAAVANHFGSAGHTVTMVCQNNFGLPAFFEARTRAPIVTAPVNWNSRVGDERFSEDLLTRIVQQADATVEVLRTVNPHMLFVNLPWPDYGLGISLAAAALGLPTLTLCHLCPRVVPIPRELQLFYRGFSRAAQRYTTVSDDNRFYFSASTSVPLAEIAVLRNGVSPDPTWIDISDETRQVERARLCAELGLPPQSRIAITVGRLDYQKGHCDLLDAVLRVRAGREDLRFLWLGEGPLQAHLKKTIASVGLADHVHLLGQRRDVARFLALADILVAPSLYEGFSLTLLEAANYGCPIVSSDCSGTRELLPSATYGVLCHTGHSSDLADAIAWAADNPRLLAAIGQSARRRVADFRSSSMLSALERTCRTLATERPESLLPPSFRHAPTDSRRDMLKRAVLDTVNASRRRPLSASLAAEAMSVDTLRRYLLHNQHKTLRSLVALRPVLSSESKIAVILAAEEDTWRQRWAWRYPLTWILCTALADSITLRLHFASARIGPDPIDLLAKFVIPLAPSAGLAALREDQPLLAPRSFQSSIQSRISPPPRLPDGLAAGIAVEYGPLFIVAQLTAFLNCDELVLSPQAREMAPARMPSSDADGASPPGARIVQTFHSRDLIREVRLVSSVTWR